MQQGAPEGCEATTAEGGTSKCKTASGNTAPWGEGSCISIVGSMVVENRGTHPKRSELPPRGNIFCVGQHTVDSPSVAPLTLIAESIRR